MDDADITDLRAEREEALRRRHAQAQEAFDRKCTAATRCCDCGDDLPAERQAIHAERCIDCQRAYEYERAHRARLWGMYL